jgi:hypothetical protein
MKIKNIDLWIKIFLNISVGFGHIVLIDENHNTVVLNSMKLLGTKKLIL